MNPFFIASLFLLPFQFALADQTAVINLTLNVVGNPPLDTSEQSGFMDLVVGEALKRIGVTLHTVRLPAERGLKYANSGIEDGELSRVGGMEKLYPNLIAVPEKIMDWEFVAFSMHPIDLKDGWQSLAPYTISFINGWKILEKNTARMTTTKVRDAEQLFQMLLKHRTDVIIYERWGGLLQRKILQHPEIQILEPPLVVSPVYVYLHKKHSSLVVPLTNALKAMKTDGTYARIETSMLVKPLAESP